MGYCFCIQPFDGGVFDKRYDDTFKPAIEKAGLKSYRVDRDPSVNVPIEEIENGIKNADICLAEITTNNPNVWYELGFSLAVPKTVVLVCSEERKDKFPFDIQHRSIIRYKSESLSDFEKLRNNIAEKIVAVLKKEEELTFVNRTSPIADTEGLSQHEMVALVTVMQNSFSSDEAVGTWVIQRDMNNVGLNDLAVSIALKMLTKKGFIVSTKQQDNNGNEYFAYQMTDMGEQWIIKNQDKLKLKYEIKENSSPQIDDLPF